MSYASCKKKHTSRFRVYQQVAISPAKTRPNMHSLPICTRNIKMGAFLEQFILQQSVINICQWTCIISETMDIVRQTISIVRIVSWKCCAYGLWFFAFTGTFLRLENTPGTSGCGASSSSGPPPPAQQPSLRTPTPTPPHEPERILSRMQDPRLLLSKYTIGSPHFTYRRWSCQNSLRPKPSCSIEGFALNVWFYIEYLDAWVNTSCRVDPQLVGTKLSLVVILN